jgi:hypothetical protein
MTKQGKIRVTLSASCRTFMDEAGLSTQLADVAVNHRHEELVDRRGTRLIACHWLSDERILLVDGDVPRSEPAGKHEPASIEELVAQVVLDLRRDLPAGRLVRAMDAEQVLAMVAESFGIPLVCDPDEPLSTLYSGPGCRDRVVVHSGCIPPPFWLLGSFDPEEEHCEYVWAFRPDRYRTWLELRR